MTENVSAGKSFLASLQNLLIFVIFKSSLCNIQNVSVTRLAGDVTELTHLFKGVGDVVPGVVVYLFVWLVLLYRGGFVQKIQKEEAESPQSPPRMKTSL